MESLSCSHQPSCPERPYCYNLGVDGVRVCKAIYLAMVASLPDDFEIIDFDEDSGVE